MLQIASTRATLVLAVVGTLAGCESGTGSGPVPVATASLDTSGDTLVIGASRALTIVLRDAAGNLLEGRRVAWSSADPARVAVDSAGRVSAVASTYSRVGDVLQEVVVTGAAEGVSASARIAVYPRLDSLRVSAPAVSAWDRTVAVTARYFSDGFVASGVPVSLTSSDTAVLAFGTSGTARAKRPGTVTVTAAFKGEAQTAQIRVVDGYRVAYVGTASTPDVAASDVNDAGVVLVANGTSSYLWRNTNITALAGGTASDVNALNGTGMVAGWVGDGSSARAAVWRDGTWTVLPGIPDEWSRARAINDHGQVAVIAANRRAYRWDSGVATSLPSGGGFFFGLPTDVYSINGGGFVSGLAFDITRSLAMVWYNPAGGGFAVTGESNVGGVLAVNDAGHQAGWIDNGPNLRHGCPPLTRCAFIGSDRGVSVPVRSGESRAFDINERNRAVGEIRLTDGSTRGVVWNGSALTSVSDILVEDGWVVTSLRGINEAGQVVGHGLNSRTGRRGPVLLTPQS